MNHRSIGLVSLVFFALCTSLIAQTVQPDTLIEYIVEERVMITGNRFNIQRIPGSVAYLNKSTLQKHAYDDINRVLRAIPGINIQEEDGFGLFPNIGMRGTGVERSSRITLMEDGILIAPAPYAEPAAYYFPVTGKMEGIEVRKGSAQIKHGPYTTGGALNLITTRIPYQLATKADISGGAFNTRRMHGYVGNTINNFGFLLEGFYMGNDGFKQLDNKGNTGFTMVDVMGKVRYSFTTGSINHRLEAKVAYNDRDANETYLGLTDADFRSNSLRRYNASQLDNIRTEHMQYSLRHFAALNQNMDLTTVAYRTDFTRNWYKLQDVRFNGQNRSLAAVLENPIANADWFAYLTGDDTDPGALRVRSNKRTYYGQGVQSILGIKQEKDNVKISTELGLRYHQDSGDRFQWEDRYQLVNGAMQLTTAGVPGTQENRFGVATSLALFWTNDITIGNWLFSPGVRYENIDLRAENFGINDINREKNADYLSQDFNVSVVIPGFGVSYTFNENSIALLPGQHTVFGGVHRGFAPPSPSSNVETRPENSWNYEFGYRYKGTQFSMEAVGFVNDYSNLLGSDLAAAGGGGTLDQFNAGAVRVMGLETMAGYTFQRLFDSEWNLPLTFTYTFTHSEFLSDFNSSYDAWGNVQRGYEMPYMPRHQFNTSINADYKRFSFGTNLTAQSGMRTQAGIGGLNPMQRTDSFVIIDANVSYSLVRNTLVYVNVRNITDERYIVSRRPAGVRPGLPRMMMAGVRYSF